MKKILYKCTFKTDVILNATSATEVSSLFIDYIPGSRFLGLVAKNLYVEKNIQKTMDLFHNGAIRFGDAHLLVNEKRTLKKPFVWFTKKGEDKNETIYLHHKIEDFSKYQGIQLKQVRKGYFADNDSVSVSGNFSIKSAYDRDKKRSADEQMFGYYGIKKGFEWCFYVEYLNENYIEEIEKSLIGLKRIGKSRSAQYGLVNICRSREIDPISNIQLNGLISIYAESNLCFYDENGQNTVQPTVEMLGLPKTSQIIWDKSQIRTKLYQTWNTHRYNRDADRQIIEKGSVFIVKLNVPCSSEKLNLGIGSHLNEGFGKVIVNPDFLESDDDFLKISLTEDRTKLQNSYFVVENGSSDQDLIEFLENQVKNNKIENEIDVKANKFVKDYGGKWNISASQWGQIRSFAKLSENFKTFDFLVFDDKAGFLYHGQSEEKWRRDDKRGILRKAINDVNANKRLEFVIKLASLMSKTQKND